MNRHSEEPMATAHRDHLSRLDRLLGAFADVRRGDLPP